MKTRNKKRFGTFSLSLLLIFCLCAAPVQSAVVYAEEDTDVEEHVEEPAENVAEPQGVIPSSEESGTDESVLPAEEDVLPQAEAVQQDLETNDASEPEPMAATSDDEAVPADAPRLVYGNPNLADDDAFVLLMFGDGFTKTEQDKFYSESEKIADYVMDTSPWDEFKDVIKIYAKGVISNESGARADNAKNQEEADKDTRDTYFGTSFWSGGMQRLVALGSDGREKIKALKEQFLPKSDYEVVIVNSQTYGGSGGSYCLASLNNESLEMMLHELGHTIANLADEYFAGASYAREYANMTAESDPEKVKWKRFIGKNGIGVYEYDNGGDGWYRPHQNCKMRFLGKQYAYCEVCKEELRRAFCKGSTVTKLFFQTYADAFNEADTGKDMSEYFIVRKGANEATGDTLGDKLHLTYKDANGAVVNGIPSKKGTYTIEAVFDGNETYDACSITVEYQIDFPDLITLNVGNKVYDGQPAEIGVDVNYNKEYELRFHYTGTIPYAAEITYEYDSDDAPIKPGRYTVEVTAYDKESHEQIGKKSKDYEITFKSTDITNNNTAEYPGAQPYYNNKTIVFTGEGFTADEQDKFEKKAAEYIKYFRNMEPYKEADIYFNYSTVEAVSNESGIGRQAKDTYFKLTYDENGKIVLPKEEGEAVQGAMYIGNNVITSYYKSTIVIVNDENVKEGATFTNKRFTVFAGMNEKDMDFAANELLNYFNGDEEGYRATTEAQKETQRTQFLKALYYTWYGTDYAVLLTRAYDETFVENGKPVDLAPYYHTYILGKEVSVKYVISYYGDNNGKPGKQLGSAPSAAGTYHAKAELDMGDATWSIPVELDGETYNLPKTRCWTTFTIQPSKQQKPTVKVGTTTKTGAGTFVVTNVSKKTVAFKSAAKSAKKVTVPSKVTINGVSYKVTKIGNNAFSGRKKLTKVTIPASVTEIGAGAFKKCTKLTSVTIPASVTKIGKNAFSGSKKLKKVTIKSKKVKSIGKNAFKGIYKKSVIKTPKGKKKAYKKLLKKAGYRKTVK